MFPVLRKGPFEFAILRKYCIFNEGVQKGEIKSSNVGPITVY